MSLTFARPALYTLSNREGLEMRMTLLLKNADAVLYIDKPLPEPLALIRRPPSSPLLLGKNVVVWGAALHSYVEERFPAPTLLPADLNHRTQSRLLAQEIRDVWTPDDCNDPTKSPLIHRSESEVIEEIESVYDPETFWIAQQHMTTADVAFISMLAFAVRRGRWNPKGTKLFNYYNKLTNSDAFLKASHD